MTAAVPRALRIFVAIFSIVAMLCVSAVSVSAAHTHLNQPVDRCDVCSAAHMTAERVAVVQVVHALEVQHYVPRPVTLQNIASRGILAFLTRGPPASL